MQSSDFGWVLVWAFNFFLGIDDFLGHGLVLLLLLVGGRDLLLSFFLFLGMIRTY